MKSQSRTGVMGRKQLGCDYEQSTVKKRIKRESFLSEMKAVMPWNEAASLPNV